MSDIPHLSLPPSDDARVGSPGASTPRTAEGTRAPQPAFEALLERLTASAAELEQKSKALSGPDELPAAMDTARASLEQALELGRELLEAYRAAQRTSGSGS
jgi:hypothetical protein